ncbi:MAG: hypothetical protein CMO55_19905 [Verrucomicrobiales bacterium]|nr:hypothetical protein [Verrucomicrobiales bacterium]
MDSFRDPDISRPSKALSLVRLHHGVSPISEDRIPAVEVASSMRKGAMWRAGARANHLHARRRRVKLEEIPERAFPVILEVSGGSNFVILKERTDSETFLVQFPDSRESTVSRKRLAEVYDGECIFLSPKRSGGMGGGLRRLFSRVRGRNVAESAMVNGLIAVVSLLLVMNHESAFAGFSTHSLVTPLFGVIAAGAVLAGIVRMRKAFFDQSSENLLADCFALPIFAGLLVVLAGWATVPFFLMGLSILAFRVLSKTVGSEESRIDRNRRWLVGASFLAGCLSMGGAMAMGLISPAVMTGALVLGTYAMYVLICSSRVWKEARIESLD